MKKKGYRFSLKEIFKVVGYKIVIKEGITTTTTINIMKIVQGQDGGKYIFSIKKCQKCPCDQLLIRNGLFYQNDMAKYD
jgi:hypothetical protein